MIRRNPKKRKITSFFLLGDASKLWGKRKTESPRLFVGKDSRLLFSTMWTSAIHFPTKKGNKGDASGHRADHLHDSGVPGGPAPVAHSNDFDRGWGRSGGRELGRSRVSILVGKPRFGRSVLGCIEADFSTKHSSPKLSENFEKKKMTLFEVCRPECNV